MTNNGNIKSIDIVTHCYNPPGISLYAEMLKWQFSSFCHHPPQNARIKWFVYYTDEDKETAERLAIISQLISEETRSFRLMSRPLHPSNLFRRSIGRDMACRETQADIVWFTDVDYLFGEGCLDAVARQMDSDSMLHMPREYWINFENDEVIADAKKHERPHHRRGQEMLKREINNHLPAIDRRDFALKKQNIAIGGMQIIGGYFARRYGYLRGIDKWQTPVDPSLGFRSCKCDTAWRRINALRPTRIDIPNLFRIRHDIDGRDYSMTGELIGKSAW